ncbi:MAG TPA: hypothetical protein VGJ13_10280 [Pseudonocardiaceae bacterium]|jgi:hypothetical protein
MGLGDIVDGAKKAVTNPVGAVEGLFGGGDPSGNDHGSSNWASWGHAEIRSMLDDSVQPADIEEGARAWAALGSDARTIMSSLTQDLRGIVSNGWRGAAADAANASLGPVDHWTEGVKQAADHTSQLASDSGYYAGQAKATVPPAPSHDWTETVTTGAVFGPGGAIVDAVGQHEEQESARADAVRIMSNVYSSPINENRSAVPDYPALVDPTLRPPEPAPVTAPAPGGGGTGGGGGSGGGGSVPGGAGGVPGGGGGYQPPATSGLQNVTGRSGLPPGGVAGSGQFGAPGQPVGGGGFDPGGGGAGAAAAAAGMPFLAPMGGAGGDGEIERSGRGFRGAGSAGAGSAGGRFGGRAGSGGSFGPRGSAAAAAAAETAEGRMGAGGAAGGRGGAGGAGEAPMGGAGGRGKDEDKEHRRPSYLIEMDDVFNDGRKVAPPVIGEDPPEYYG